MKEEEKETQSCRMGNHDCLLAILKIENKLEIYSESRINYRATDGWEG